MNDILFSIDNQGCARLILNREATHNAFDNSLIDRMQEHLDHIATSGTVRLLILSSRGKNFSAGANLHWMKKMASYSEEKNFQDAMAMASFFQALASLPIPTLVAVQGAALGGGLGLVAACDIGIASTEAIFGMPEVRLGLLPAVIFPYVAKAMGARSARAYGLTGEIFSAQDGLRLGLIHHLTEPHELEEKVSLLAEKLLANGKDAMVAMKTRLMGTLELKGEQQLAATARIIAELRNSQEGQEGITAFLQKRKPNWNR